MNIHGRAVADSEVVSGEWVHLNPKANPTLKPKYFIFIGKFEKNIGRSMKTNPPQ